MLKRRSIRTKLVVALTLLSAIVLLLATSCFWGLHRYQQLARAITYRATEFQLAHQLNQSAEELKAINDRITKYKASELASFDKGLIESDPFADPLPVSLINMKRSEELDYEMERDEFRRRFGDYLDNVDFWSDNQAVLIDRKSHSESLGLISAAFEGLEENRRTLPKDLKDLVSVYVVRNRLHEELATVTTNHLDFIQRGMEEFSEQVRGECKAWMIVAYTCTILAFLMMGLLIAAFRSLVIKPFRTLVDGSRLVAGGQFDHRIDLGTGDELSELAEAMNEMTDRFQGALAKVKSWCTDLDRQVQERTREVIQNEQLASVGFLAAGVAHEINNPLASIAWSAESLQSRAAELTSQESEKRVMDDELYEIMFTNLRRIEDEAYRCKGITEKLLDFSRLSEVQRAPTDLAELVSDVVLMVGTVGKYRCKTIRTHATDSVIVSINPQEIRQVVLNLVTNALESVDCDGAVDVYVNTSDEHAVVVVQDNGCGMSQEVLKHLFEPFFTRRRDGTGTGLGLSITYRIVSQHGGSLLAQSEGDGRGSRLEMHLPLCCETADIDVSTTSGWNHGSN